MCQVFAILSKRSLENRDANLWRSKIRLSHFHYPPPHPPNFNRPPSPRQIDPAANGNGLGHYMSVLHKLYAIKIRDHRLDAKIILSVTKCVQKCLRNRTTNKKIQILREKWAKSQTISKEKCKRCLVREIC